MNVRTLLTFTLSAILLAGCGYDSAEHEVLRRVTSPDGKHQADLVQFFGGGPVIGVFDEVYVHPVGAMPDFGHRVFSSECAHNIGLTWRGPRLLQIDYDIAVEERKMVSDGAPWWRISSPDTAVVLKPRLHRGGCSG